MPETNALEIALLFALVALIAVWAIVVRDAWRAWKPGRLLLAGRYPEARAAAQRLRRSWMRIFRTVRLSADYVVGCALHLEGDLEGSLATLAPLHRERLPPSMRCAICSIDAANLVLLGRGHARADALLEEAARIHRPPEDILLSAHAKLALGQPELASKLFAEAGEEHGARGLRIGRIGLAPDRRQQEAIFHALRALYLVAVGRSTDAQRDLDLAARSPVASVYVERARAMLQARDIEGDPRSSLAPQIVGDE